MLLLSASSQRSFQGNELMRVHNPKKLAIALVSPFSRDFIFVRQKHQRMHFLSLCSSDLFNLIAQGLIASEIQL